MQWNEKKIDILIIVNTKENSITINKYIIYSKEYHLFESTLYYLNNQKKKKITDNECFNKYNYFLKNYCINEYFNEIKQLIQFILSKCDFWFI